MTAPLFNPTPDQLDDLLDDLSSPDLSLRDLARRFNTTIEAFSAWLYSEPARPLLEHSFHAATLRTRLAATHSLPSAVQALVTSLQDFVDESHKVTLRPSLDTMPLREGRRTSARRAAHLLHRLANFTPRSLEPHFLAPPSARAPSVSAGSSPSASSSPSSSSSSSSSASPPPTQPSGAGVPPASTPSTFRSFPPLSGLPIPLRASEKGKGASNPRRASPSLTSSPLPLPTSSSLSTRPP